MSGSSTFSLILFQTTSYQCNKDSPLKKCRVFYKILPNAIKRSYASGYEELFLMLDVFMLHSNILKIKLSFFGTTWPTSKKCTEENNGLKKTKLQQDVSYKEQIYILTNVFQPVAVIKVIEKWIADRIVNTINTWV